jgi:hypothetical protein
MKVLTRAAFGDHNVRLVNNMDFHILDWWNIKQGYTARSPRSCSGRLYTCYTESTKVKRKGRKVHTERQKRKGEITGASMPMRPKARGLVQHVGPPGWLEKSDQAGCDFVRDRWTMPSLWSMASQLESTQLLCWWWWQGYTTVAVSKQEFWATKLKYSLVVILYSAKFNDLLQARNFKQIWSRNLAAWQWHSAALHNTELKF